MMLRETARAKGLTIEPFRSLSARIQFLFRASGATQSAMSIH